MIEIAASYDAQLSYLAPFLFYLIVGALVFVETGVLLGFFLPGDSLLFSAGIVAASHGNLNIALLCFVIFLAAFIGDQVGFAFGRTIGRSYLDRRTSPRMQAMIKNAEDFVLDNFKSNEQGKVREIIKHGSQAIQMALEKGIEAAMNRYNTK